MATPGENSADKILAEAREYGQQLAMMLAASHFSDLEKQAWAALVPDMTPAQLRKFEAVLKADMSAIVAHDIAGLLTELKAAQHTRDLSLAALREKAYTDLEDFEKQLQGDK